MGGGGGASSAGGGGMSTPIAPMNSNVANATAVEKAVTPNKLSTGGAKSDQSLNVIMNVDGVQFGKVVTKSLSKNSTVASGDQTVINPGT
jgi:hypothetical protein